MNLLHLLFGKRPQPKAPPKAPAPIKSNGKPGKRITRAAYKSSKARVSSADLAQMGMSNKPRNGRHD